MMLLRLDLRAGVFLPARVVVFFEVVAMWPSLRLFNRAGCAVYDPKPGRDRRAEEGLPCAGGGTHGFGWAASPAIVGKEKRD
jgi:hypothetical protein